MSMDSGNIRNFHVVFEPRGKLSLNLNKILVRSLPNLFRFKNSQKETSNFYTGKQKYEFLFLFSANLKTQSEIRTLFCFFKVLCGECSSVLFSF